MCLIYRGAVEQVGLAESQVVSKRASRRRSVSASRVDRAEGGSGGCGRADIQRHARARRVDWEVEFRSRTGGRATTQRFSAGPSFRPVSPSANVMKQGSVRPG